MIKSKTQKENKFKKGFSLVEILVVLAVFAILGIVVSQSLLLVLRSARKSDTSNKVRESLDFAVASMERQLHNAIDITPCPNADTSKITVMDQNRQTYLLSCANIGPGGYIASASAKMTSADISIVSCSFVCTPSSASVPISVAIDIAAQDANAVGPENTRVMDSTTVYLRTH